MHIEIFNKTFIVDNDITIDQLKKVIEDKTFLAIDCFSLVYGSSLLQHGLLSDFNIIDNSLIDLVVMAEDGMRAKWRKKRMRRLRRKRRKMRNRAK